MKILLPPSETKRPGGDGAPLDIGALELPALAPQRIDVVRALVDLADDDVEARRVLKLSDRQLGDIKHNRMLRTAPTMPAVDRYTGVLFDALDAPTLSRPSRRWLGEHVWIHSAPLGPVGALDGIPTYRLSAGTALPGVAALRRHWAEATTQAMAEASSDFVLDLRSEAYVALGPVPATTPSVYVRVVVDDGDGGVRALNHFNKKSKGLLVRALAEGRPKIGSLRSLLIWAGKQGIALRRGSDPSVVELVASE